MDEHYNYDVPYTSKEDLRRLKSEDEAKYKAALAGNKKYRSLVIRVRESEIIRIVEQLAKENKMHGDYPFIDDLIWLKVGNGYNTYLQLANKPDKDEDKGIITFNGSRYKNLICSSSNVRSKKALFIKEDLFDKVNKILLCGIPEDYPYEVFAKFNSYFGLPATDSIPVSTPNVVVVKDPESKITEIFDVVRGQLGESDYTVTNGEERSEYIKFADGAGLVDVSRMQQWVEEINAKRINDKNKYKIDYLPAAVQFRAIPGIKGNLFTFDLKAFVAQLKFQNQPTTIIDFWGKEWDFQKDNIDCIMTASQFKFAKVFTDLAAKKGNATDGFSVWMDEFQTKCEGYSRTFNISEISDPYRALKHSSIVSYQPLQTLQFRDEEVPKLCSRMVNTCKRVHTDIDAFLNYRGIIDDADNEDRCNDTPPFYMALKNNHTLYNDPYIKKKIGKDLKSLRLRCYAGKIIVDGNYQVLTPDLFALAQAIFGQPVTGLLKAGEIYSNYWNNQYCSFMTSDGGILYQKGTDEVDIIRNPHIAVEHCPAKVVQSDDLNYWFKYQDTGIIFNAYDSFALRLNSADYDGDHVLTTSSKILIDAAKRANIKTVWPDIKDAKPKAEDGQKVEPEKTPINDITKIIQTNAVGMQNSIGNVVNKISILWSLPSNQTEEIQSAIKIMSVVGSLVIDFAKTGVKADIPADVKEILKGDNGIKPLWMRYLKSSSVRKANVAASNADTFGLNQEDIKESYTNRPDCTMQKLSDYIISQIKDVRVNFDGIEEKENSLLSLCHKNVDLYNQTYKNLKVKLVDLYKDYQLINHKNYCDPDSDTIEQVEENNLNFKYFYDCCRTELAQVAEETGQLSNLLDYLITICETEKEFINADKSIIWNAFGEALIERSKDINYIPQFNLEKLKTKQSKARAKIEKEKETASRVTLKVAEGMEENFFDVSKSEIAEVKKMLPNDKDAQRLFLILLGISRKNGYQPLAYVTHKWTYGEMGVINKSKVCDLCRFSNDGRKFNQCIKLLREKKLVDVKPLQSGVVMILYVLELLHGSAEKCFKDINDYADYIERALKK